MELESFICYIIHGTGSVLTEIHRSYQSTKVSTLTSDHCPQQISLETADSEFATRRQLTNNIKNFIKFVKKALRKTALKVIGVDSKTLEYTSFKT